MDIELEIDEGKLIVAILILVLSNINVRRHILNSNEIIKRNLWINKLLFHIVTLFYLVITTDSKFLILNRHTWYVQIRRNLLPLFHNKKIIQF